MEESKASTCPLDLPPDLPVTASPHSPMTSAQIHMKSEHTAAFNAFKWLQRGLHRVKDLEIFWILHAALIITEAGLTPHIPVGRIRVAQKAVIAFSTLLYIILILSYVDPEAFVDIKTEEQGGVRVEARHPRTGVLRLGYLQKYSSSSINSGSVLFDDDVLAASNAALAAAEGKQPVSVIHTLTAQPLLVHEMRTVIRRQPLEEYKNTIHIVNLETELTMLSIAREQGLEENRIERYALILGWVLIILTSNIPGISGIAALRMFRLFRILWYYKIPVVEKWLNYNFELSLFSGERKTVKVKSYKSRLYIAMELMVQNLESLGKEMFTVTGRGGLLLMLIFFYAAFIFGAAYWIETGTDNTFPDPTTPGGIVPNTCSGLSSCVYTMMRLTFWDGTGFDYGRNIMLSHKALFALLMMYMCITAFGMLNGLTGIFGDAFARNIKRREQLAAELAAKEAAAAGAPAPLTEREFNVILMEIKGTLISQGNRMQALSKRISLE